MDHTSSMLYRLRHISQSVVHTVERNAGEHSYSTVSPVQMMILDWLSRSGDAPVFQKDIARRFNIRHSSVTAIIQNMERNAVIERRAMETDARLKRIRITEKGAELAEKCRADMDSIEELLRSALTGEELESFFAITGKLIQRLDEGGSNDKETC
ncbi:MAG: MarR family transcriptional regulator [Eubacteriaceae bacterium]|nr:MarR family transcriptional regulator [Eubacteriaceae bacterium]